MSSANSLTLVLNSSHNPYINGSKLTVDTDGAPPIAALVYSIVFSFIDPAIPGGATKSNCLNERKEITVMQSGTHLPPDKRTLDMGDDVTVTINSALEPHKFDVTAKRTTTFFHLKTDIAQIGASQAKSSASQQQQFTVTFIPPTAS